MRTKDFRFFRIKAALADLIDRCGGQRRAGELIGVSQQMMSKVSDRENGAMLSIEAKLLLEMECGAPVVTQIEAELLGYHLTAVGPRPKPEGNVHSALSGIVDEVGELLGNFAQRVKDGDFSRNDGVSIDADLADVIQRAEQFRDLIAHMQATTPA